MPMIVSDWVMAYRFAAEVNGKSVHPSFHVGLKIDGHIARVALACGIRKGDDRVLRDLFNAREPVDIVVKGFDREAKTQQDKPAVVYTIKRAHPISYELVGGVIARRDLSDSFSDEADQWLKAPGFEATMSAIAIDRVIFSSEIWTI